VVRTEEQLRSCRHGSIPARHFYRDGATFTLCGLLLVQDATLEGDAEPEPVTCSSCQANAEALGLEPRRPWLRREETGTRVGPVRITIEIGFELAGEDEAPSDDLLERWAVSAFAALLARVPERSQARARASALVRGRATADFFEDRTVVSTITKERTK
jgi:hypothetical protein